MWMRSPRLSFISLYLLFPTRINKWLMERGRERERTDVVEIREEDETCWCFGEKKKKKKQLRH